MTAWSIVCPMTGLMQLSEEMARRFAGIPDGVLSPELPVCCTSAPGHIDVLGGLASEAGGVVAQMALPRRAAVALQWRSDGRVVLYSRRLLERHHAAPLAFLARQLDASAEPLTARSLAVMLEPQTVWAAPLLALIALMVRHPRCPAAGRHRLADGGLGGLTVVVQSDVPMGAAQGSSTALLAALAQAISLELNFPLNLLDKALLINQAESLFDLTYGSVVDALTALAALDGPPAHLLRFSAQPHELVGQITLPPHVRIVALDTGVHTTRRGETVRAIRMAGAMGLRIIETIYRDMGQTHTPLHGYLGNLAPSLYRRYFRTLLPRRMRGRDFLRSYGPWDNPDLPVHGEHFYRVRTAVDHLIAEHEHAENFLQAMEELSDAHRLGQPPGDPALRLVLQRAGRLLLASQHSYRLRLNLSCPQADWMVDRLMESGPAAGIYGARISQCGSGGSVVALVDAAGRAADVLLAVARDYPHATGLPLRITAAGEHGCVGAATA